MKRTLVCVVLALLTLWSSPVDGQWPRWNATSDQFVPETPEPPSECDVMADDASEAKVEEAIAKAASIGVDSVTCVPAGSATWAGSVTISTRMHLVGAGMDETIITLDTAALELGTTNSSVGGFTFQTANNSSYLIRTNGSSGAGRIHHNRLINTTGGNRRCVHFSDTTFNPHPVYLIDSNDFQNCRVSIRADDGSTAGEYGEIEWESDRPWGVYEHVIFIEDNTFTYSPYLGNFAEIDYGGMMTVRFNGVVNSRAELHGTNGFNDRAGRWMEVYANNIDNTSIEDGIWWRGGSGLGFMNVFASGMTTPLLFDVSTDRAAGSRGMPDGTKPIDSNQGSGTTYPGAGWIALDQPGYGKFGIDYDGTAYPQMASEPIPLFLNRRSGAIATTHTTNGGGKWISNCHEYQQETASFNGTCGTGVGLLEDIPENCTAFSAGVPGTSAVYYWATDQGDWNTESAELHATHGVSPGHTQGQDGVLYKCTSTDNWEPFYEPYPYPHPLRGE